MTTDALSGDTLQIFLHDIRVQLRVGYHPAEHQAPQPIVIALDVTLAALPDYTAIGDDLTQLLDYAPLHHFLTVELPQQPHRAFLEDVAERILRFCWRDARVTCARVRLQKPEIFPGTPHIGVVLERKRPGLTTDEGAGR